jgi:phosphatidylglycerophosphate synthase
VARFSFAITGAKTLLACLAVLLAGNGSTAALVALVAVAMVLDVADGAIFSMSSAYQYRYIRDFRRVIDSATDRLLVQATLISAVLFLEFPAGLYSVVLFREISFTALAIYIYKSKNFVVYPNTLQKISVALIGVNFMFFLLDLSIILPCLFAFILISVLAFWQCATNPQRG